VTVNDRATIDKFMGHLKAAENAVECLWCLLETQFGDVVEAAPHAAIVGEVRKRLEDLREQLDNTAEELNELAPDGATWAKAAEPLNLLINGRRS
jgi:hypothetical protein